MDPSDPSARDRWEADRTTFQRVYDVLVGLPEPATAADVAKSANCSETAARRSLAQLVEMGIAESTGGRPRRYGRNDSYFRWKRIENLARDHSITALQEKLDELLDRDTELREMYEVPAPDAVSLADVTDHDEFHERWDDVTEWRTVRRDITVIRRAIDRAESIDADEVAPT